MRCKRNEGELELMSILKIPVLQTPPLESGWSASSMCRAKGTVPQRLALGLAPFNIFVGNMDSGIECTLSKSTDDTKLCGVVKMVEVRDVIQGDLNGLER